MMSDETMCGACGRQRTEHDDQQHYYCATVNLQTALTRELAAREAAEKERDEATAHAAVVQRLLDIDHEKVLAGNAALAAERVANAGLRGQIASVVFEVGGMVDGQPTGHHNYLQRIRGLVANESGSAGVAASAAEKERVAHASHPQSIGGPDAPKAGPAFAVFETLRELLKHSLWLSRRQGVSPPEERAVALLEEAGMWPDHDAALSAAPPNATTTEKQKDLGALRAASVEQIEYMVQRFLTWKLPANFSPDAGISFKPAYNEGTPWPGRHEPMGTNLFDANQATAMVRHLIDGMPSVVAKPHMSAAPEKHAQNLSPAAVPPAAAPQEVACPGPDMHGDGGDNGCCLAFGEHMKTPRTEQCCSHHHPAAPQEAMKRVRHFAETAVEYAAAEAGRQGGHHLGREVLAAAHPQLSQLREWLDKLAAAAPQEQQGARTSAWVTPGGKVVELGEWTCPDCGGQHIPALGGIRVGHPCPRTAPASAASEPKAPPSAPSPCTHRAGEERYAPCPKCGVPLALCLHLPTAAPEQLSEKEK